MADPAFAAAWAAREPAYQLARLRILKGLTQAQLAERVGTPVIEITVWHEKCVETHCAPRRQPA